VNDERKKFTHGIRSLSTPRVYFVWSRMSASSSTASRDMIFSVLFVGDEHLLRHLVWTSAQRLGADWAWEGGVQVAADSPLTLLLLSSL